MVTLKDVERFRFATEALPQIFLLAYVPLQNLDGHATFEKHVAGQVHAAHTTRTELACDRIVANRLTKQGVPAARCGCTTHSAPSPLGTRPAALLNTDTALALAGVTAEVTVDVAVTAGDAERYRRGARVGRGAHVVVADRVRAKLILSAGLVAKIADVVDTLR